MLRTRRKNSIFSCKFRVLNWLLAGPQFSQTRANIEAQNMTTDDASKVFSERDGLSPKSYSPLGNYKTHRKSLNREYRKREL